MPQIKEGWADALEPIIREWFFLGQSRRATLIPTLFNVQTSTKDTEKYRGIGAVAPEAWDEFSITGTVPSVSFDEWFRKDFTHTTRIVELPIQQELIEDALLPQVTDAAFQLGDSAMLKREVDAAGVFNGGFSGTTGPDSLSLFNDSHTAGPNKSATQDNSGTTALTKASVATTREAMMAFTDDVGNLMAVTPDTILVPPELEDAALEISKSLLDPTSANNTINPQAGRFQVAVWHYLTDSNNWFMLDSVLMKQSLYWFDRIPLGINLDRVEKQTFAYFLARMRYSFGWRDWRFAYGHAVA